jgi:uncharacterized protein YbaP (TraB family)
MADCRTRGVNNVLARPASCLQSVFFRTLVAVLSVALVAASTPVLSQAAQSTKKFSKGLLWRVSRGGVRPSYVFGTIHIADPRVRDVPEAVGRALLQSKYYYVESFQGEREAVRFFETARFEDGRRLEPLIGAQAYAQVAEILRAREVPENVIARVKPWAALINLTETPEDYEKVTLDQKLLELAREHGLSVLGLESIEDQISAFDKIPLKTQVELLRHALAHRDELAALLEPAIEAWLRRDLAGIHAATDRIGRRYPEMAEHYRILFKTAVENRSIVMAHRLFTPLREGRVFAAVGANHLYGPDGILALIEQQGYRVERIY